MVLDTILHRVFQLVLSVNLNTILIISIAYALYWMVSGRYNYFRGSGITGPPTVPFFGNLWDFMDEGFQLHRVIDRYYLKYGKVFGFYYCAQPVIVVGDEDIAKEILGRKCSNFKNRKFLVDLPTPCHKMITMATGEKWKHLRSLLTSALAPTTLKASLPLINKAGVTLADQVEMQYQKGLPIDIVSLSHGYIMETLLSISFSIDCPNQSEFNKTLNDLVKKFVWPPKWIHLLSTLPLATTFLKHFPMAFKSSLQPFIDTATRVIEGRLKEESDDEKADLLQALLNAQKLGPDINGNILTNDDILAQGIVLLTAVHMMTANTLSAALYHIAKDIHIQNKIHGELDNINLEHGDISWDCATKELPYLDDLLRETMRLYPAGFVLMRECNQKCEINGVKFERGSTIFIPTFSMQRDESKWSDPLIFDPERFRQQKSRRSYLPFGEGPHMCMGNRISFVEMKIAIISILKHYSIALSANESLLELRSDITVQAMLSIRNPVIIKIKKRQMTMSTQISDSNESEA